MITKFLSYFSKQTIKSDVNIWEHKTWGDGIYWKNFEEGLLYGKTHINLQIGTVLADKIGEDINHFKIVHIEYDLKDTSLFWCKIKKI